VLVATSGLTTAQEALIRSYTELGLSTAEVALLTRVGEQAVKSYTAAYQEHDKTILETSAKIQAEQQTITAGITAGMAPALAASNKAWMDSFLSVADQQERLATLGMTNDELALRSIQQRYDAEVYELDHLVGLSTSEYDRRRKVIDAAYKHERDLINYTYDTLEDRLRAAGILTQDELVVEANKAWVNYSQAVLKKGKYTTDQLQTLWKKWFDAQAQLQKNYLRKWDTTMSAIGQLFDQIGQGATSGSMEGLVGALGRGAAMGSKLYGVMGNLEEVRKKMAAADKGTRTEGLQEGLQSYAAMASAMIALTKQTGSTMENVMTGVIAGAMSGAAAGWQGMVAGAIIGGVSGWASATSDAAKEEQKRLRAFGDSIREDFGTVTVRGMTKGIFDAPNLSDQLLSKIDATFKSLKAHMRGVSDKDIRAVAESLDLGAILAENPLSKTNVAKYEKKLTDLFSYFKAGTITIDQTRQALDKSFGAFAEYITKTDTLASKSILNTISLQREMGIGSEAIAAFVTQQVSRAATGFNALASAFAAPLLGAEDLRERLIGLNKELSDPETTAGRKIQVSIEIGDITKRLNALEPALVTAQGDFDRMGRLAVGAFAAAVASGQSFLGAINAVGPGLDALILSSKQFGFTASGAFDQLLQMRDWVGLFPETAGAIQGLDDMLKGLHNSGYMNQELFLDLGDTAASTFQTMLLQGRTGAQALQLMAPSLQTLWELQTDFGYAVDDATRALLDQAIAAGVVGDKQRSAADRAAVAMERVVAVLEAMATAMGVTLPKAANAMVAGINGAVNGFVAPGAGGTPVYAGSLDVVGNGSGEQIINVYFDGQRVSRRVVRGAPREIKTYIG